MVNHWYSRSTGRTACGGYSGPLADSISVDDWGLVSCNDCQGADYPDVSAEDIERRLVPASRKSFESHLEDVLVEIDEMMMGRHKKYGPGNIAEFGPLGILVRMSDKFARLKNGQENHDDETVENTLDDVIGYALIWKLWLRGQWPGSLASKDSQ